MEPPAALLAAKELQLTARGQLVSFHGGSMEPFLKDGDQLRVEAVTWVEVAPGDIVTYRLDDRFPTLRVVHKGASKLVLRGDRWPFADFDVWEADLLGRVTERRRGGDVLTRTDLAWRLQAHLSRLDDRLRRLKRDAAKQGRRAWTVGRRVVRHGRLRNDDPAGLHVNVSASCNLGCKMCPYLGVHDNPGYVSEMSEETFRTLLPAIARLPSLHISGAGEPFFNRDVVRFIQLAREANPTIDVDITTNGTLITETMARALIGVHLTRLVISLDGATERTVGAIRLGINFRKVLDHIRTLTRLKQELGSPWPKVRVNYMVGYGSYAELPEFMRLAWEIGVEEVHLLDIFDGTAEAFEHNLVNSMARDQARALRDAKKLADGRGIRLTLPYTQHNACLHPYTPHVSEQGLVSPCCYVDYDGRTFWQGASSVRLPTIDYGNINSDAFGEIWTSPAYTELRARNKRGDFPDFCRTCHSARVATSRAVHDAMD